MSMMQLTTRVMPQANYPCYKCEDRHFDADGRRCHATCERYLQSKRERDAVVCKAKKENARIKAADEIVIKGVIKTQKRKGKVR